MYRLITQLRLILKIICCFKSHVYQLTETIRWFYKKELSAQKNTVQTQYLWAYLWCVKRPEAYSNKRNSLKFEPKLKHKHAQERHGQCWWIKCAVLCTKCILDKINEWERVSQTVLTVDCETGGVCSDPADLSNGPQTTSCWVQY